VEIIEAEEGAAYGAAILAGVGVKVWPGVDQACDSVVRVAARVKPKSADVDTMNRAYAAYRRMYPALQTIAGRAGGVPA
jgi:xylulokinase